MYPFISTLIAIVGVILFAGAKKIAKDNYKAMIVLRIIGSVFIALGLAALYFVLSGKLKLPLSEN